MKIDYEHSSLEDLKKTKRKLNKKIDNFFLELSPNQSIVKRKAMKKLIQNKMKEVERLSKYLNKKKKEQ